MNRMEDFLELGDEKGQSIITAATGGEAVLEVVFLEDVFEKPPTQRFAIAEMERKKKKTLERDKIREGKETGRTLKGQKDRRRRSEGRSAIEHGIWSKVRGKPVGSFKKRAAELANNRQRAAAMEQKKKGLPQ